MAVRVRMFASLRESAGTGEAEVAPGALGEVLGALSARFGEPFAARLAVCSVLVDGTAAGDDPGRRVPDGAELVLLPPVSGGARDRRRCAP